MGKNIVVLTGSPRKKGNTFAMADAFVRAAEAKGHTVTRFDTALMNVGGCHACETCYSTGKPCTFDDDFNTMAPALLAADGIVFAMPTYWYTMPAQIKAVLDKMFSFVVGKQPIQHKQCALIACCEEQELSVMDGVRIPYEKSAALMEWENLGEVLVPGVLNPGDVKNTDGEARAAALADLF